MRLWWAVAKCKRSLCRLPEVTLRNAIGFRIVTESQKEFVRRGYLVCWIVKRAPRCECLFRATRYKLSAENNLCLEYARAMMVNDSYLHYSKLIVVLYLHPLNCNCVLFIQDALVKTSPLSGMGWVPAA